MSVVKEMIDFNEETKFPPVIQLAIWQDFGLVSGAWQRYSNPLILSNTKLEIRKQKPFWFSKPKWEIICEHKNYVDILGAYKNEDSAEKVLQILLAHGQKFKTDNP
jgi:hypothetical protein